MLFLALTQLNARLAAAKRCFVKITRAFGCFPVPQNRQTDVDASQRVLDGIVAQVFQRARLYMSGQLRRKIFFAGDALKLSF